VTTAGSPDHFAFKVLEHARRSALWRVAERPGPVPWLDPDRLAEQRALLPEPVYRQLFENEWTAAEGALLDPAMLEAAFCLAGPALERDPGAVYGAGLDLGGSRDRSVLAIGHRDGDAVFLDRMQVWQGSRRDPVSFAEVERFIVQTYRRFRFRLSIDPWQALDLAQRLRAHDIDVHEFSFTPVAKQRLAATLLSTLNAGRLRLYEADGLRDELLGLRLVQNAAGAWTFRPPTRRS
jgi:hypothetical protein